MGSVAREEEGLLLDEVLVEKRPLWCSTYRHCMDLLVDNPLCISSRVLWALLHVSQIISWYHMSAMASHVDVVKAHLPLIEQLDGSLVDFSQCLLLLHSYIFAHASTNCGQ